MSFMESPRFPEGISYGVAYGPEFVTSVGANQGAYEVRNRVRTRAWCRGDCAHAIRTPEELAELIRFFRSVGGRFSGFRFKDWSDYQLAEADSRLALVAGTVNQYQLCKLYQAAAGFSELRALRKPVAGTVVLKDGGSPVTAGAGAGQYSVDTVTGIITLVAQQSRAINSHTVGAAHQFTLASALSPQPLVGEYVAVSGATGTASALIVGQLLEVTAVSGALVTVAANTTGLAATGGTLSVYRQHSGLTASCEFDNACRFDVDHMAASIESFAAQTWGQIPVKEYPV